MDQIGPKTNQKRAKNRLKWTEVSVFVSKIKCLFFYEKLGRIGWHPLPAFAEKVFGGFGDTQPHPTLYIFHYFGHLVKKHLIVLTVLVS